ncbi:ESPR-type extended signal peptide-containing protein [Acinetobacter equi]|uniref:Trimeric autotransporter adhesin YadA-like head domain-containing protein n=1 Tax=Acinetobacter equi TaxID=1324350 RepID=A0A0N9VAZ5_9GAMM|nr:ESPR-type extended signal peptide-containing protein [Acinetobacter equi]ALH94421.1 hypothetical protein AOY20_02050 [Acinetobacter equi]
MNKIYKVIWHASLGIWIVVSELSKGKTKTKCKKNEIKKSNKNNKCFVKNISIIFTLSSILLCTQSIFAVRTITTTGTGNAIVTSGSSTVDGNANFVDWNNANNPIDTGLSGGDSVVIGNASSSSISSVVVGSKSIATTGSAIIVGMNSKTIAGDSVVVIGNRSTGSGSGSIVLGRDSVTNGAFSLALGSVSAAVASRAVAIGHSAIASGINSIAFGGSEGTSTSYNTTGAQASGNYATAIGTSSISSGVNSIAFGTSATATATATSAIALGYLAQASKESTHRGENAIAVGLSGITTNHKYIYKVGAGTDSQSSFSGSISVGFQW